MFTPKCADKFFVLLDNRLWPVYHFVGEDSTVVVKTKDVAIKTVKNNRRKRGRPYYSVLSLLEVLSALFHPLSVIERSRIVSLANVHVQ